MIPQPKWNDKIIDCKDNEMKLKDVGCCYYKMETNDLIPNHSDAYNVYTEKFNCSTEDVHKILIFLEDWRSGHYFELEDKPIVDWKSGDYYQWKGKYKTLLLTSESNQDTHFKSQVINNIYYRIKSIFISQKKLKNTTFLQLDIY